MASPLSSRQSLPPAVQQTAPQVHDFTNVTVLCRGPEAEIAHGHAQERASRALRAEISDDLELLGYDELKRIRRAVAAAVATCSPSAATGAASR